MMASALLRQQPRATFSPITNPVDNETSIEHEYQAVPASNV